METGQRACGLLHRASRWLLGWAVVLQCLSAQAQDGTLVSLLRTGRIALGASDVAVPFSYLDPQGVHVGYHMDICQHIVRAIQQRFDLPPLSVTTLPTSPATRFSLLGNRSIDIECGYNPVNASALSQALLTHAIMNSEVRLVSLAAKQPIAFSQLDGKTVATMAGGTAVAALRTLARRNGILIREAFGRQPADTFALLDAGRVDAVALPTPYLLAQRANAADPARYALMDGALLTEPVALMFRLEDEKLHALANEVVAALMKSGEMARLYDKWFMQPIPGLRQPLGLPLPPALRLMFDAPGSELLAL